MDNKKFAQDWFVEIIAVIVNLILAVVVLLVSRSSDAISEDVEFMIFGITASITVLLLSLKSTIVSRIKGLSAEVTRLAERVATLENRYSQTDVLFSALGERDHFFEIALIYGLRAYGKLLSEKRVVVNRDYALDFWLDSIRGCKRWFTITYSRPEESWDLKYGGTMALSVQQERIAAGGEIRRLFLIDDQDEYEHLKRVMKEQESIGVNVKWLLRSELPKQRRISECIKALGTLDFALVDDSWVWKANLNRARRLMGAEAIRDKVLSEKARVAFNEIFSMGNLP